MGRLVSANKPFLSAAIPRILDSAGYGLPYCWGDLIHGLASSFHDKNISQSLTHKNK